ncbi:hypothetical protein OIO90_006542 [Microbotryomycetes sp. JL221]|nr:hypothetical protein OIO90_006542 [Microbotryomycetes sp. JL221]
MPGPLKATCPRHMHATLARQLKLLALPLTKASNSTAATDRSGHEHVQNGLNVTRTALPAFLIHAKRVPVAQVELKNPDGSPKKLPAITRATTWATNNWQKLGHAPEGTWKRKAYVGYAVMVMGDKFMDRIEYEEWALKAIDPELSPKLFKHESEQATHADAGRPQVDLVYPKSLLDSESLVGSLRTQLDHRERAKTGWQTLRLTTDLSNAAWKASQYLRGLLDNSQLRITPSELLDRIYGEEATDFSKRGQLLLTADKVPKICQAFDLSEEEAGELKRAVSQSEQRLQQVQKYERSAEELSAAKADQRGKSQ